MILPPFMGNYGVRPVPLKEARNEWDEVISNCLYAPAEYLQTMVKYQSAYVRGQSASFEPFNMVFFYNDKPVGIWPLNVRDKDNYVTIGSNATGVLPPLLEKTVSNKQRKIINKLALGWIDEVCHEVGQKMWRGAELLMDGRLSTWHTDLMRRGATLTTQHELYVNLDLKISQIKSQFRKSYRPLITKAGRLWRSRVISDANEDVFEAFRKMHIEVAGRETRCKNTWDLQRAAVGKQEGFLVFLEDTKDNLVGAALFQCSRHEAVYSVGVYDRSQFDKPLGHLVQMTAIEHMKSLGLKWYRLGHRVYPGDLPVPDEKDINIAFFKEGFATDTRLVLHTHCPVENKPI